MSEKISFNIEAAVKGLKDITSTTTATERLTEAVEEQREAMKQSKRQLNELESYDKAKSRIKKLGGELDNARSKYQRLGDELKQQNKNNAATRTEYKRTQKTLAGLQQAMKNTSGDGLKPLQREAENAERKMQQLDDELRRGQQASEELRVDYRKSKSAVSQLTSKKIKQIQKTRNLRSELRKAGVNTRDFANEQKRLQAASEKTSAQLDKQSKRLKEMQAIQGRIDGRSAKLGELGGEATGLAMKSAPLVASMFTAIKNESSFADVKKVRDMSPEQAAELRSWALKKSEETTMDANQVNQLMAAGARTGIKSDEELRQFVNDADKMGVAFGMDAAKAGKTLAVFKSSMGLNQQGAMNLAGLANYLDNNTDAEAKDIAGVMSRQGATAKSAGFSVNEATALSASLLSFGMGEERAATAMKNISGRLTMGDAATSAQKNAFNRIGLDSTDIAARMQENASGTLIDVLDAIKSAPIEEQSALMSQIFGEEAKGAVASLAGNTSKLHEALKLASASQKTHSESINTEYEEQLAKTEAGLAMFMSKVNRLSVVFGAALLPALNSVLGPIGEGVSLLADFAEANQGITAAVGMAAAGFIGLKGALIAGKAASLLFGNTMDKGRLFRKGLNRETREGGRIAQFAARQWQSLNQAVRNSNPRGGQYGGEYGAGYEPRKRQGLGDRVKRKTRRTRARFRRRGRGLGGLIRGGIGMLMQPALTSTVRNTATRGGAAVANTARALNPIHNKKAVALSLGGGAVAAMPATAMAADAIGIGGDIAESAGKFGLSRILKPLSYAVNSVEAYRGIRDGNGEQAGSALGDLGGSLAGAAAGAALGSVVPGIGTAIGGLVGGIAGGLGGQEIGAWFGRKLDPPEVTAEKIKEVERKKTEAAQKPPVSFAPQINITSSPGQNNEEIAEIAMRKMEEKYAYATSGNDVSTQLGYSGIDQD